MSGSGCHGDHLPGTAVSASPEQLRHQEILPGLCAAAARPPASRHPALLQTELSLGDSTRARQLAPTVDPDVPSHTRWQPFLSGIVMITHSDDYSRSKAQWLSPPPSWSSWKNPHPGSQGF